MCAHRLSDFTEIGLIKSDFAQPADPFEMRTHESIITVHDRYTDGLYQLEANRHIQVVFHFHRSEGFDLIGTRYHGEEKGVFASRSPRRPSAIGVTTVELLRREGNRLVVRGLDAIDGTPVLDLKPYAPAMDTPPDDLSTPEIRWHEPGTPSFPLSGLAWHASGSTPKYRRLPVVPSGAIPPSVDRLADSTAGVQLKFRTDSPVVRIRAHLAGPATMYHMPATGQCGFDLYLADTDDWEYSATGRFELHQAYQYETDVFAGPKGRVRSFLLNFPLYQGVSSLEVGLTADARIESPPEFSRSGRVVVYGTSITQGGCASRPGMLYTNILSRRLDTEFVNLGFSGSGKGEPEVVSLVASVEQPSLFILDYEANTEAAGDLGTTLPKALDLLREHHADVPIAIVSRVRFARDLTNPDSCARRDRSAEMQQTLVKKRREAGDKRIHFIDGRTLLGADFNECTVDGVHLTDLGFMRMADSLEPMVRSLLDDPERELAGDAS